MLFLESNLCYGEGGAGTWSDGKLTTSIGKKSHLLANSHIHIFFTCFYTAKLGLFRRFLGVFVMRVFVDLLYMEAVI